MSVPRFPSPPAEYERAWGNQYTRLLEQTLQQMMNDIQLLQQNRAPNYSTADRLLISVGVGTVVFDTDIDKLFVMTSGGWEQITSV